MANQSLPIRVSVGPTKPPTMPPASTHEMALVIARQIIDAYPEKDESAYYNAGCYCSLIGQRWAKTNESAPADYSALAIDYLRQAIGMDSKNKKVASEDADFMWLKSEKSEEFAALIK